MLRILTSGPRTDVHVVRLAGRARYETLLGSGVRVYEWQPTTLHAKTFVVDGEWLTVGSMNFDNRSMALNDEATLMVLDRKLGAEMNQVFLDDLRHAGRDHGRVLSCALMASTDRGARRQLADAATVTTSAAVQVTSRRASPARNVTSRFGAQRFAYVKEG